jgi:hypothetical protein
MAEITGVEIYFASGLHESASCPALLSALTHDVAGYPPPQVPTAPPPPAQATISVPFPVCCLSAPPPPSYYSSQHQHQLYLALPQAPTTTGVDYDLRAFMSFEEVRHDTDPDILGLSHFFCYNQSWSFFLSLVPLSFT